MVPVLQSLGQLPRGQLPPRTNPGYAIKSNSRTIRSLDSQPASAGKEADMSELQLHHCITAVNSESGSCAVCVIPENKVSLQELTQLIGLGY